MCRRSYQMARGPPPPSPFRAMVWRRHAASIVVLSKVESGSLFMCGCCLFVLMCVCTCVHACVCVFLDVMPCEVGSQAVCECMFSVARRADFHAPWAHDESLLVEHFGGLALRGTAWWPRTVAGRAASGPPPDMRSFMKQLGTRVPLLRVRRLVPWAVLAVLLSMMLQLGFGLNFLLVRVVRASAKLEKSWSDPPSALRRLGLGMIALLRSTGRSDRAVQHIVKPSICVLDHGAPFFDICEISSLPPMFMRACMLVRACPRMHWFSEHSSDA